MVRKPGRTHRCTDAWRWPFLCPFPTSSAGTIITSNRRLWGVITYTCLNLIRPGPRCLHPKLHIVQVIWSCCWVIAQSGWAISELIWSIGQRWPYCVRDDGCWRLRMTWSQETRQEEVLMVVVSAIEYMMLSWHGNTFRITGHLDSTKKGPVMCSIDVFFVVSLRGCWTNSWVTSDLGCLNAQCDLSLMILIYMTCLKHV